MRKPPCFELHRGTIRWLMQINSWSEFNIRITSSDHVFRDVLLNINAHDWLNFDILLWLHWVWKNVFTPYIFQEQHGIRNLLCEINSSNDREGTEQAFFQVLQKLIQKRAYYSLTLIYIYICSRSSFVHFWSVGNARRKCFSCFKWEKWLLHKAKIAW